MDRISTGKVLLSHSSHELRGRAERWNSSMSEMIKEASNINQMQTIGCIILMVVPVNCMPVTATHKVCCTCLLQKKKM